jgi:hypothetical protein
MITITIVPQTQAQIAAVSKLLQDYPASIEAQSPDQPSPPKTAPRASSAKASPAPAPEAPTQTKSLSLEDVRAKLSALSQAGKKDDVAALIATFGAAKLTEVKLEDYAALLAKAEKL